MTDLRVCLNCVYWSSSPAYNADALKRHPEWTKRRLCEHPQSKMYPEWEGAEVIATEPDFGCNQFEQSK